MKLELFAKIDDLFCGNSPKKRGTGIYLQKILDNIQKVKSIPIEKRKLDF